MQASLDTANVLTLRIRIDRSSLDPVIDEVRRLRQFDGDLSGQAAEPRYSLSDLVHIEPDSTSAAVAGELLLVAKPTELYLGLVSALRAREAYRLAAKS